MEDIKSAGLIICILMVLMAYLKQVIPRGKSMYLMNAIISVFILISIVDGVRNFDFASIKALMDRTYSHNEAVWENAAGLIGDGLKNEFQNFLLEEHIDAEVNEVTVEGTADAFEIKRVIVSGNDAETARNLLAGRYQIGIAYIEVKNE